MRSQRLLLSLAALAILHPASHATVHTQSTSHQHTFTARQAPIAFHPSTPALHRQVLFTPAARTLPQAVNPPARTTVFSYVVNLIRGVFSRTW